MISETWELSITDFKRLFFHNCITLCCCTSFCLFITILEQQWTYVNVSLDCVTTKNEKWSYNMSVCGSKCFTTIFNGFVVSLYGWYTASSRWSCSIEKLFCFFCVFLLINLVFVLQQTRFKVSHHGKYLRFLFFQQKIVPQPIVLQTPIKTLNDLQKLLETINWLRHTLGISTEESSCVLNLRETQIYYLLSSRAGCRSPWSIATFNKCKIQTSFVSRGQAELPLRLFLILAEFQPYALIAQPCINNNCG